MKDQDFLTEANKILSQANPSQVSWVMARLTSSTDKEAAKKAKVHPTTVSAWGNKSELDKAVNLLLRHPVVAAIRILEEGAIKAVSVLFEELNNKRNRLIAARDILDRLDIMKPVRLDVTTDGESIKSTDAERDRAMVTLAQTLGQILSSKPD